MKLSARSRIALTAGLLALALFSAWFFTSRLSIRLESTPTGGSRSVVAPAAPITEMPTTRSAENDPGFRAALEAARSSANPQRRAVEFGRLLMDWIARDPAAALAYVRRLPPGAEYTQGVLMVLGALGREDPDRALVLARELVSTREQRAIYSSLFAQLAASDPAAAVPRLALVPAGESRDNALRALADGWAGSDLSAALAWARKLGEGDRGPAMESVLAALVPSDPLQASDLARQTLTGEALDRTLVAALQTLSHTDPKAAADLVSLLAPGEVQTQAALAVARALTVQNPDEALAWSRTLPADGVQRLALSTILEVWVAQDPVAAGRYVAQMTPGPTQETAAARVARILAAADPTNAVAWAQTLASDSARSGALAIIASAWAQRDPAAATRWAAVTPALAVEALHGALSYWVQRDAGAAQEFVLTLAGDTQVHAAAYIAPALAQADPLKAIAWTQTLSQPAARDSALTAAYARWLGNAPAAARAWLATANLPPQTKARLADPPVN